MKRAFIKVDGGKQDIQYIGIWNVLDILTVKIYESKDVDECRTYCQLYKMIYELKGGDKDEETIEK